jgi:glycosyltransferase involved in cell wall biosynthesis
MPQQELILIDTGFRGLTGHHYSTALMCAEACRKRKVKLKIFARAELASSIGESQIKEETQCVFRNGFHAASNYVADVSTVTEFFVDSSYLYDELCKYVTPVITNNSIVLCHTANITIIYAIYKWLEQSNFSYHPEVFINIQSQITLHEIHESLYSHVLKLVEKFPNVHIFGSNAIICKILHKYSGLDVKIFPIPFEHYEMNNRDDNKICFGIAGEARDEKNYHIVAPAIREYINKGGIGNFILQAHFFEDEKQGYILNLFKGLERDFPERVHCRFMPLYGKEYYACLASYDAIILAYAPQVYGIRISQVVMDAIFMGSSVITCAKTSLADELLHFGAGGIIIPELSERALVKSFFAFEKRKERYKSLSRAAALKMREYYNLDSYMDILLRYGTFRFPEAAQAEFDCTGAEACASW